MQTLPFGHAQIWEKVESGVADDFSFVYAIKFGLKNYCLFCICILAALARQSI